MSNAKQRAIEIYNQHIELAKTDGRLFRRTVMEQLKTETGCTQAAAATHYNNAKKAYEAAHGAIAGLGRAPQAAGVRKMSKGTATQQEQPDEACYTVLEVVQVESLSTVGRTHSFEGLGLARIKLKDMIGRYPKSKWKLITGLGPNSGDTYKLAPDEKILVEYPEPDATPAPLAEPVPEIDDEDEELGEAVEV